VHADSPWLGIFFSGFFNPPQLASAFCREAQQQIRHAAPQCRALAAFAPRDQSLEAPMPRLHARSRKFYAGFRFARFGRCASSGKTAATTGRRLR